jgi:hypothetical protein
VNLLKDTTPSSVRYQTAEEVNAREPFNRWPPVYFIAYFEKARSFVLRNERILSYDNRDFLADIDANPRNDLTRRGESLVHSFNYFLNSKESLLSFQQRGTILGSTPSSFIAESRHGKCKEFSSTGSPQAKRALVNTKGVPGIPVGNIS